jgi:hypothetical protein
MRARDRDFLRELDIQFVLERVQFLLQLLLNLCQRVGHSRSPQVRRKMMRSPAMPNSATPIIRWREIDGQEGSTTFEIKCVRVSFSMLCEQFQRDDRTPSSTDGELQLPREPGDGEGVGGGFLPEKDQGRGCGRAGPRPPGDRTRVRGWRGRTGRVGQSRHVRRPLLAGGFLGVAAIVSARHSG